MITITVDTQDEYDMVLEAADTYVCTKMTREDCIKQNCAHCYMDNHLKFGINVIYSVDNNRPD